MVKNELIAGKTPLVVRNWVASPPMWFEVRSAPRSYLDGSDGLDEGERAAIALASLLEADLLLMDDRKGVITARRKGLRVTGTLGILDLAAKLGIVDFATSVQRLRRTNFRAPESILDQLLRSHSEKSGNG